MARRNFYDIINNSEINIRAEYDRIYELYHSTDYTSFSVDDLVNEYFLEFPESFRKRTISLDDFNNTYKFDFGILSKNVTLDVLVSFCEYVTNLYYQLTRYCNHLLDKEEKNNIKFLKDTIDGCIDELGLMPVQKDDITIFIEKNSEAIAVAEIVPIEIAFSVLQYNHHKLKGDLNQKKIILKAMADNIESERKELRNINATLESQLYQLMNKFVRHDHSTTPYIMTMKKENIEDVYDDIYQLWLLAKLELDNLDRKKRMKELLDMING